MADDEVIPPISPRTRRRGARDAMSAVLVAALVLLLCQGPSIERSGVRMEPGPIRTTVLAVGTPAAAIAERLPFAEATTTLTAWLRDDEESAGHGSSNVAARAGAHPGAVQPVTPEAFAPEDIGAAPPPRRAMRRMLVTGDSMAMPLDAELARRLADGRAVQVSRDPHIGTGISKSDLVDWGELSAEQIDEHRPDAVVVFIGANEGFPMRPPSGGEVECCDARWAAEYASRARIVMNTYRRDGQARVYWLALPMPRDRERARIARVVNAAVRVAAQPYRSHVRVLDAAALFTPGGRYRDAMPVGGREELVRDADGIHLNDTGARVAADAVLRAVAADFENAAR